MAESLSPGFSTTTEAVPTETLSPGFSTTSSAIPTEALSPGFSTVVPLPPPLQVYSSPTGGTVPAVSPTNDFGGVTSGATRIPPAQGFAGPTAGAVPTTPPASVFGGTTGEEASIPPPYAHGAPTVGRVALPIAPRFFGAATGGVIFGIPKPINLTATPIDAGCIRLDWVDPSDLETGYRLERSLADADDWDVIATLPADTETFLDRFAVPLVVYDYRVIGFDAVKESTPSNIATAVTGLPPKINTGPPPSTPTDPQRNKIKPQILDLLSPGVYGLEQDEDGDVTGFKF